MIYSVGVRMAQEKQAYGTEPASMVHFNVLIYNCGNDIFGDHRTVSPEVQEVGEP